MYCVDEWGRGQGLNRARVGSAACCLGDSEAVFQHLKANNLTMGDGEHDREVRLKNLAGSLELGDERTNDYGSICAGQNVMNFGS